MVNALLAHLERVGFAGAPRLLGRTSDRDILSWVEGRAYPVDRPHWLRSPSTLAAVGRLLRAFHDATASWSHAGWVPLCPPPAALEGTVVCHGDLGFGNVVFRETTPVALIDFEFLVRADRLYDVATVASVWPAMPPPALPDRDDGDRFYICVRAVADGYGLLGPQREGLAAAMVEVERGAISFMRGMVEARHPVAVDADFASLLPHREERLAWLQAQEPRMASRLAGG